MSPRTRPTCPQRRRGVHLPAGCRCRVDAADVHAMIRDLAGAGWSLDDQGRMLGAGGHFVWFVLHRDQCTRATVHRITELYARLITMPGPSIRSVTWAARHGWPLVDHVVISRLIAGERCPRLPAERDAAIRVLAASDRHSVTEISTRVHTSGRQVRAVLAGLARAELAVAA